ncbi:sigma factor [Streptomyces sp. NPDC001584]|uniref:sigma factor n=1 Tax=Streptomyces sp. NPDC001584 TaxID=3154521 RepID=UPI003325C8AE
MEGLRQVAQLGLAKAVSRFDPDCGTAFEAFAVPAIVGEVKRHFRDSLWAVHVPRRGRAEGLCTASPPCRLSVEVRWKPGSGQPRDSASESSFS